MVRRDHTCQYPFCIQQATKTCSQCHEYLCSDAGGPNHLKNHKCKYLGTWQGARPFLDTLKPGDFDVVEKKGKKGLKVKVDPEDLVDFGEPDPDRGPSRKEWRKIIEK